MTPRARLLTLPLVTLALLGCAVNEPAPRREARSAATEQPAPAEAAAPAARGPLSLLELTGLT
jgi:hypothetical protein